MLCEGERIMEYLLGRNCHRRSCDGEGDERGVRERAISECYQEKKHTKTGDMGGVC